ncbi:MAG: hypothetical protein ABI432_00770 [Flavobacteriales bacterium]
MSVWRRKAIKCVPELHKEFEDPEATIHTVFSELQPALETAHKNGDVATARRIYDFAFWCFTSKEKMLWNAAGVAFYEHLGDHESTAKHFTQFVDRTLYLEIQPLLAAALGEEKMQELNLRYGIRSAQSRE